MTSRASLIAILPGHEIVEIVLFGTAGGDHGRGRRWRSRGELAAAALFAIAVHVPY